MLQRERIVTNDADQGQETMQHMSNYDGWHQVLVGEIRSYSKLGIFAFTDRQSLQTEIKKNIILEHAQTEQLSEGDCHILRWSCVKFPETTCTKA